MVSRILPLKSSASFKEAFVRGKKIRAASWLTIYVMTTEALESKYGMTLSRKVANSVIRNKLKRWVRASARSNKWPQSFRNKTVVFVFRPQSEDLFFKKLKYQSFLDVLAKFERA